MDMEGGAAAGGAEPGTQAQGKPRPAGGLGELIAAPELIKAAEAQNVLWARVRGFPHWPVRLPNTLLTKQPQCLAKGTAVTREAP